MNAKAAIALLTIPINLGIGLFVLSRDTRGAANRLFFVLMVFIAIWGVGDFISLVGQTPAVVMLGRKVAAAGWFFLAPTTFLYTLTLVGAGRYLKKRWLFLVSYGTFAVLLIIACATGLTFRSIAITSDGFHLVGGPLRIPMQAITVLVVLACSVVLLAKGLRLADKMEMERMVLMGLAILLPDVGTVFVEVLVPYKGSRPVVSGLDLTMIMAAIMAYAVTQTGLLSDVLASMGRAVLPVMKDPVFVLNPGGLIETTNPAAALFTSYAEDELRGSTLQKLFPADGQYGGMAKSIEEGLGFEAALECVVKDGSQVSVVMDFVPVKRHGTVIGFVVIMHDMSAALDLIRMQERERMAIREVDMQREYSNELKNIIDVANHELRHPASVFKGYTSTLINNWEQLDRHTVHDFLQALDMASDRLARLTVDLLDTSYIESSEVQLAYGEVMPGALLASAIVEVGTRGFDNEFEIAGEENDRAIRVDAEKIGSVLAILLDNAAKFSPARSCVEASFRLKGRTAVFSVSDRGRGVPDGHREKIFQRLYQVDDALHHSMPGLGLGLYIAAKIVDAHRGWIIMEPREGGGSVFSFGVPIAPEGK